MGNTDGFLIELWVRVIRVLKAFAEVVTDNLLAWLLFVPLFLLAAFLIGLSQKNSNSKSE